MFVQRILEVPLYIPVSIMFGANPRPLNEQAKSQGAIWRSCAR
jgi:hypothetical protein